jgi:flagellar motor switch/type III secretory pathway protein FliN
MNSAVQKLEASAVQKLEANIAEPTLPISTPTGLDLLDTMPWLPCTLSLELPVVRFTIGDLLKMTKGSIVQTGSHHTSDVPLRVNQLLIGWTEFEVVGDRLAVRITDQA